MRENELMIGDWVMVNDIEHTHPLQVAEIYNKCGAYYATLYWDGMPDNVNPETLTADVDKVLPIPLTQVILEKNGFVPKFSDGCLIEYLIYKDIVDGLHEMYIKIFYFKTKENEHKLECFDCRTGGCQIWIKYVHQLQQALRLCGIEKEIEL